MTGAVEAFAMARGGSDDIDFVVKALARPIGDRKRAVAGTTIAFAPELANTDTDLAALERALARWAAAQGVSLCLYGPSGTGKTGFARRIADAMSLDALLKVAPTCCRPGSAKPSRTSPLPSRRRAPKSASSLSTKSRRCCGTAAAPAIPGRSRW
ncbi:MAG TPA: hypothetical protein VLX85_11250 [Stellaceae bacterium]|nr:hypothetical protein [Stellaceae bacterium]